MIVMTTLPTDIESFLRSVAEEIGGITMSDIHAFSDAATDEDMSNIRDCKYLLNFPEESFEYTCGLKHLCDTVRDRVAQ